MIVENRCPEKVSATSQLRSSPVRRLLLLVLLALPAGAAESPGPPFDSFSPAQINAVGRAIFDHDRAAWLATDAVLAAVPRGRLAEVRGWVTRERDAGWLVRFVERGDTPCSRVDVAVGDSVGEVEVHEPCAPLTESEVAMFAARQTAAGALENPCSDRYNTVVLPASLVEREGWLVYLLASTTKPGAVVAGGHRRVLVSADGGSVVSYTELSSACLTLDPPDPDASVEPVAMVVTHVISDTPIETHVFLSLAHERPLLVMTSKGIWQLVSGDMVNLGSLESFGIEPDGE